MRKQFGAKPSKLDIKKYADSNYWKDNKFENLEATSMSIDIQKLPKLLYKQFCKEEGRIPLNQLPIIPFNTTEFLEPSEETKFIWYGHSVVLMRLAENTILIDPMFGDNAAPISPFPVKRFSQNAIDLIDDFPEIDLLILTHDHYDHLDYDSIQKLKPKVKKYFVAVGIARHLIYWGIDKDDITEFDWWQQEEFNNIKITFTPTRHFSGRGLTDRAKSLWGGWVFKTSNENIWFSGDGGYGEHFKEIGDRLGPFDFAFMECGQYNDNWHLIHMFPEESTRAAQDANTKKVMAVHWAGFALAQHPWTEPIEEFSKHANLKGLSHIHPQLGQLVRLNQDIEQQTWWK